jgi:protein-arginine kinase activator protein McsA
MKCDNCPSKSRHLKTVRFGDGEARKKLKLCPECVAALRRIYKDQENIREFQNGRNLLGGETN